ncbi:MAG: hypothetical protein A2Z72_02750 [Omnitrophica bacterium RBG_13_46_9]|nr:MAG: hypothetical protein A2Z72_02750 [Omnitrophica bacterium RBG_13_46_9]
MRKIIGQIICIGFIAAVVFLGIKFGMKQAYENRVLREIVGRLEADSRAAEVLVTGVNYDDKSGKVYTTIKFLEYDVSGKPLTPKYFTFSGNVIQFQSLVIRFDDICIRRGDRLRGKSAYFFWKVFMLNGSNTEEYVITKAHEVPEGYRIEDKEDLFEKKIWEKFWRYSLDPHEAQKLAVKNAQIEAPGTIFVPGMLYTVKIEHDGGLRIDASPLAPILKGERIPS